MKTQQPLAIGTGFNYSAAVDVDGNAWIWGISTFGSFGIEGMHESLDPMMIKTLSNIKAVALGQCATYFLDYDGRIWVCGWNQFGQLGVVTGPAISLSTYKQIPDIPRVAVVSSFYNHAIFLDEEQDVWTVGWNNEGQLGLGDLLPRDTPTRINSLPKIVAVSAGRSHSLFTDVNGYVWGCGYNERHQLGLNGSIFQLPTRIKEMNNIKYAEAGANHSVFIGETGEVWVCGSVSLFGAGFDDLHLGVAIVKASASIDRTLLLDCEGEVWMDADGDNYFRKIKNIPKMSAIKCAPRHILLLDCKGELWSSGQQFNSSADTEITIPERLTLPPVSLCSPLAQVKSARKH